MRIGCRWSARCSTCNPCPSLRGFRSHYHFHLTTAPGIEECDGHVSVSVVWHSIDRHFDLAFGQLDDGWAENRPPERICGEEDFLAAIESFLQRLLA